MIFMTIRILPPDEAAKKAKERVAEWKRQREIDAAKARVEEKRTGAVAGKSVKKPEEGSKLQTTRKKSASLLSQEEKQKLDTKLVEAAERGDINAVKGYIAEGADVNAQEKDDTALDIASREGHKEIVGLLLENGAEVRTALHWAAAQALIGIVELLLDRGADINARDGAGFTPLFWAAEDGNVNTVAFLLDKGADVNIRDYNGNTVQGRTKDGSAELLSVLKKYGATE